MYNRVILIGRLTRDPELRYTPNGKAVARIGLAVNGPFNGPDGRPQTVFVDVSAWNKLGEICANNLSKGRMIAVEGKLNVRTYEAKDGSGKRIAVEVVADTIRFLDRPKEQDYGSQSPFAEIPDFSDLGTEVNFAEDDLPF